MSTGRARSGKPGHQEMRQTRSHNQKPTKAYWVPKVPEWEKSFCASVGAVPWGKILEAKKSMPFFKNILQWDDSAGEETFKNAKSRYYADNNGLSCNIPLPDPDLYIDEIDWDNEADHQLILDLELDSNVPRDENVVILDYSIIFGHLGGIGFGTTTGWGDIEFDTQQNNLEQEQKPCICDTAVLEDSRKQYCNPHGTPAEQDRCMWQYRDHRDENWDRYDSIMQSRNADGKAGWKRQGLDHNAKCRPRRRNQTGRNRGNLHTPVNII